MGLVGKCVRHDGQKELTLWHDRAAECHNRQQHGPRPEEESLVRSNPTHDYYREEAMSEEGSSVRSRPLHVRCPQQVNCKSLPASVQCLAMIPPIDCQVEGPRWRRGLESTQCCWQRSLMSLC